MVTVAPGSAAPEAFTAFTLMMPAVDNGIFKVEAAPPVTVTVPLRGRYPGALAVNVWLPLVTLETVYTPLALVETAMVFHLTVAPDRTPPVAILVMVPVTVPVDAELRVRAKLAVVVAFAVTVTLCVPV